MTFYRFSDNCQTICTRQLLLHATLQEEEHCSTFSGVLSCAILSMASAFRGKLREKLPILRKRSRFAFVQLSVALKKRT